MRETIEHVAARLRGRTVTSVELVEAALTAIAEWQPKTNAFTVIHAERAREDARHADRERAQGLDRGPLHGVPISLKDLIDVAGDVTSAGSRVLRDRVATVDAPVVTRLRQAGAVVIGRTNLHEFALGTTSEDSAFGPVRHPRDGTRSAGGSSGGSAVAVATGMGFASIGTDTGGSIRIPAAACGIVGLKPSIAEVPTDGVIPLSSSFDHVGPLALSVQDAAWVWQVLSGRPIAPVAAAVPANVRLVRLTGYYDVADAAVHAAFERAIDRLRAAGMFIGAAEVSGTDSITPAYVNIVLPEAAAWHAPWLESRAADYTAPVRSRLESGRKIAAVDYLAAQQACGRLFEAVEATRGSADALVLPTLPIVAPPQGADEVELGPGTRLAVRAAMLRNTQLFNMTGHPAISLPLAGDGWPVGLQLVGRPAGTEALLPVAAACERVL